MTTLHSDPIGPDERLPISRPPDVLFDPPAFRPGPTKSGAAMRMIPPEVYAAVIIGLAGVGIAYVVTRDATWSYLVGVGSTCLGYLASSVLNNFRQTLNDLRRVNSGSSEDD